MAKKRTLEYDVAMGEFHKEMFQAILIAEKIKNSTDENFYKEIFNEENNFIIPNEILKKQKEQFSKWGNNISENQKKSNIAYEIYNYLKQKQVSKAVTAQIFTEILNQDKNSIKERIEKDEYMNYITYAIYYATGGKR